MAKRKGLSASGPRTRSQAAKESCGAWEVENAQRLDKLPPEVWRRILAELDNEDLFPLALSCRHFRRKQNELVKRTRQSGPDSDDSRRALKTNLRQKLEKGQPASAEYVRFCIKEKPSRDADERASAGLRIRCLAAYHGHLPLLQELLKPLKTLDPYITVVAGESSIHILYLLLLVALVSDSFLSSSQRAEANWRPCSG